jgi:DHA1 family bicyclomycin/chloramphenicol resistance-like MFS transporter
MKNTMLYITFVLLSVLSAMEMDMFLPTLPEIREAFAVNTFALELLLSLNLFAYCVACLFTGYFSDRYGKKISILIGSYIFIFGSFVCVLATDFSILLMGRVLQGIGISSALLSHVVISDQYSLKKQEAIFSKLNGISTFAMAFAPVLGSFVALLFSWRANFSCMLILSLVAVVLVQTLVKDDSKNQTQSGSIFSQYLAIMKDRTTMAYLLLATFITIPYWCYLAITPILFIEDMGISLTSFGFYQGAIASSYAVLSLTYDKLIKRFGARFLFNLGFNCAMLAAILTTVIAYFEMTTPLNATLISMLWAAGITFPYNIIYPRMLSNMPEAKGKLISLYCAIKFLLVSAIVQLVGYFYNGTLLPTAIAITTSLILGFMFAKALIFARKLKIP